MPLWATGVRLSKDFSEKKRRHNLRIQALAAFKNNRRSKFIFDSN